MSIRKLALILSAATALVVGPALAAHADPTLYRDSGNGSRTVRVHHPDHPEWYINVSLDNVLGFRPTGDAGPEFVSPYAEISDGPGVLRWQTNNLRQRVDFTSPIGLGTRIYVNDYFPSPVANPRDNTPNGPGALDACTANPDGTFDGKYKLDLGEAGSLYDERAPKDGVCEDATQLVPNPLNSASDYSPDATVTRARGDWTNIGDGVTTSGTVAMRVFFLVRWANNELTYESVGSNFASFGT